ncbi:hypothetical protein [Allosphingosinicella sp.]|uniref:hypothetical protein n=1 Tax=Allosphingosinicella sp. TaxID=2823234 RepID=UPI002F0927B1
MLFTSPASARNTANASSNAAESKALPKQASTGTQLATSELVKIELESQQLNQRLLEVTRDSDAARRLEPVRPQLPPLLTQAQGICGQPDAAKRQFYEQVTRIVNQIGDVVSAYRPGPWQAMPSAEDICASPDFPLVLLQEVNGHLATMAEAAGERVSLERRLAELSDRRQAVIAEMSNDLAGTSVADDIPWLMLIIFGVGAVTLAGVKLFSEEVQQELIASGQIVQFVTILILLGVILALGLAQRLQAETLGTLLGGLAGYVLSQGVGRQAQQKVLNEMKVAAASAAVPPPAPAGPAPGAPETTDRAASTK